jgi:hypothetical protein
MQQMEQQVLVVRRCKSKSSWLATGVVDKSQN